MRSVAFTLAIAAILVIVVPLALVDRLIFQPTPGVDLLPADLGVAGEEVFLELEEGLRIHGFYLPAPGATRVLLFLHGNAGNASHRLPNAVELMRLGTDVLLLDYRGYGRSQGVPSESGVYADGRSALHYLAAERGFSEKRIVVFGRSLGGAVAVEIAQGRELAGLILESTFSSMADVVNRIFIAPLGAVVRDRFSSLSKISEIQVPILFFHGEQDEIIPIELGRRLYDAAPEPKDFETIIGAGHNDTTLFGGKPYFERIRRFLDQVAPES